MQLKYPPRIVEYGLLAIFYYLGKTVMISMHRESFEDYEEITSMSNAELLSSFERNFSYISQRIETTLHQRGFNKQRHLYMTNEEFLNIKHL